MPLPNELIDFMDVPLGELGLERWHAEEFTDSSVNDFKKRRVMSE